MSQPSRSVTEEVAEKIRARIASGEFQPGDRLPSTKHLAQAYGVSEDTIRHVVKALKASGDAVSQWGRGVFVRKYEPFAWDITDFERGPRPDNGDYDAWAAGILEQGKEPGEELLYVTDAPGEQPPADVRDYLRLGKQDLAVCRRRLRTVDGEPHQLSISWFPADVALNSPLLNPGRTAVPGGILASIGHAQVRGRDRYRSRMPLFQERQELQMEEGTTLLEFVRVGFDAEGRAVRCMYTLCPGDRTVIERDVEF